MNALLLTVLLLIGADSGGSIPPTWYDFDAIAAGEADTTSVFYTAQCGPLCIFVAGTGADSVKVAVDAALVNDPDAWVLIQESSLVDASGGYGQIFGDNTLHNYRNRTMGAFLRVRVDNTGTDTAVDSCNAGIACHPGR